MWLLQYLFWWWVSPVILMNTALCEGLRPQGHIGCLKVASLHSWLIPLGELLKNLSTNWQRFAPLERAFKDQRNPEEHLLILKQVQTCTFIIPNIKHTICDCDRTTSFYLTSLDWFITCCIRSLYHWSFLWFIVLLQTREFAVWFKLNYSSNLNFVPKFLSCNLSVPPCLIIGFWR